ncbi:MAG: cellulase family glycosylhydrolase [Oscillospiraceae bacterium]|jgi:endoglucanase|nr:cellulase family glycosylhydrolase [Oscillospiraceae bacterium]
MKRRLLSLFLALAAAALFAVPAAAQPKLNKTSRTLVPGETYALKLSDAEASVTWSSSDSKVAAVSKTTGKVTAAANGKAVITAKSGGKSYKCAVTVQRNRIKYAKSAIEIGETLSCALLGKNTEKVKWSSADTKIASVSSKGVVTGKSAGKTKITASFGTRTRSFTVTVKKAAQISKNLTAAQLAGNIKVGWNLGNTLDATGGSGLSSETSWGNPKTTKANIDALKKAGFNAVRIPVSWHNHVDGGYNIDKAWMARVKEVVGYAAANDMYIILNTHHDNSLFKLSDAGMKETEKAFKKIWEQIAGEFKSYGEKLIFEGLNEPRVEGSSMEWQGGTAAEHKNLNRLNQLFVDTVRASGGNNARRVLMIPTYAASAEAAAMNGLTLPNDPGGKDKIIVSIHAYTPYNFALNQNSPLKTWSKDNPGDTRDIDNVLNRAYETFVKKGTPVIIGEMGALNKDNNTGARSEWAEYYTKQARKKGIACFWWDNGYMGLTTATSDGFGILDRRTGEFKYPEVAKALTRGAK